MPNIMKHHEIKSVAEFSVIKVPVVFSQDV